MIRHSLKSRHNIREHGARLRRALIVGKPLDMTLLQLLFLFVYGLLQIPDIFLMLLRALDEHFKGEAQKRIDHIHHFAQLPLRCLGEADAGLLSLHRRIRNVLRMVADPLDVVTTWNSAPMLFKSSIGRVVWLIFTK